MSKQLRELLQQQREHSEKTQPLMSKSSYLAKKSPGTRLSPIKERRPKSSMEVALGEDLENKGMSLLRPMSAPLVDPTVQKENEHQKKRFLEERKKQDESFDRERKNQSQLPQVVEQPPADNETIGSGGVLHKSSNSQVAENKSRNATDVFIDDSREASVHVQIVEPVDGGTAGLPLASRMRLEAQFQALDINGDGVLDEHEVTVALSKSFPNADKSTLLKLSEMMTSGADTNADGKIDFDEFISYFEKHQADRLKSVENLRAKSSEILKNGERSGFRDDPLSHLTPAQVEELVRSFTHYEDTKERRLLDRDEVETQVRAVFGAASDDLILDVVEILFETADRREGFHGIRIDPSQFFVMFVQEAASSAAFRVGMNGSTVVGGVGAEVAANHSRRNSNAVSPITEGAPGSFLEREVQTLSSTLEKAIDALETMSSEKATVSSQEKYLIEKLTKVLKPYTKGPDLDVVAPVALSRFDSSNNVSSSFKESHSQGTYGGNISGTGHPSASGGLPPGASFGLAAIPKSPRPPGGNSPESAALKVSGSSQYSGTRDLNRESQSIPDLDERLQLLFSKLRLISRAPKVYKDMVQSKECVIRVNDFAFECSRALRSKNVLEFIESSMAQAGVAESAVMLLSSASGDVVNAKEQPTGITQAELVEMINNGEPLYLPDRYVFPLANEDTWLGVVQIFFTDTHPAPNKESKTFKRTLLQGMSSVAAMTIQNFFSFREAQFHREKAEAMLRMAEQLSMDNLDEDVLVRSIMNSAKELINANRCSVFLVSDDPQSKGTLTAYFEGSGKVTLPAGTGIAGHVAQTGEIVNIPDCYSDVRFNPEVDKKTGYKTTTMLCLPVQYEGATVGVAQLVNKETGEPFNYRDVDLFQTFSTFVGVCLRNCRVHQQLVIEKKKSEAILAVAEEVSECDIRDVKKVASHVLKGAKDLLGADRASLFLVDDERHELYSSVADQTGEQEIRFPVGKGIAGIAAAQNKAENIHDAYDDPRFNREYDVQLGYVTKSMLTQPISHQGEVLAVAQLVNKLDKYGKPTTFTNFDEEAFHTFSLFAGISLSNSRLLEFAVKAGQEAMALHSLDGTGTSSMMSRHSSSIKISDGVSSAMVERLLNLSIDEADVAASLTSEFDIFKFRKKFEDPDAKESVSTQLAAEAAIGFLVKMIVSTGLPQLFDCEDRVLCKFIASCRSKYRAVPYHNFFHAVDVCQTICTYIKQGKLDGFFPPLQQFILLITALVHDLDHMGVNNSFHLKTDSPLGMLSSASGNNSVLEVHHCNVAIAILEDPNKNVFAGMEKEQEKVAYKEMIECVLATDMARHGGLVQKLQEIIDSEGALDPEKAEHRILGMQMVLKAADISNVTKPFDISRLWGMAVTEEFYRQGDAEKAAGKEVIAMFDRTANNELAKGQLGFIGFVAEPFFYQGSSCVPEPEVADR